VADGHRGGGSAEQGQVTGTVEGEHVVEVAAHQHPDERALGQRRQQVVATVEPEPVVRAPRHRRVVDGGDRWPAVTAVLSVEPAGGRGGVDGAVGLLRHGGGQSDQPV
jgi:hypothetical protein